MFLTGRQNVSGRQHSQLERRWELTVHMRWGHARHDTLGADSRATRDSDAVQLHSPAALGSSQGCTTQLPHSDAVSVVRRAQQSSARRAASSARFSNMVPMVAAAVEAGHLFALSGGSIWGHGACLGSSTPWKFCRQLTRARTQALRPRALSPFICKKTLPCCHVCPVGPY